jgi:quinol monooxygenase YgiN
VKFQAFLKKIYDVLLFACFYDLCYIIEPTGCVSLPLGRKEIAMLIVHVFVHVKPDQIQPFKSASIENARHSRREPGMARFEVLQQADDPTRFLLVEVYRTKEDPARHKETAHYQKWRETVADMMAQPRHSVKYVDVYPETAGE